MKIKKKQLFIVIFFVILFIASLFLYLDIDIDGKNNRTIDLKNLKIKWNFFSDGKSGKVVYAVPPNMFILYLNKGIVKKLEDIQTKGGPGRLNRGETPRPFWNHDGKYFVYRFNGSIYISDENGKKRKVINKKMDTSKETRWSFTIYNNKEWIFGPTLKKTAILIDPEDPSKFLEIFNGGIIDKHCEMTGDGKHIVYDNGKDIFLSEPNSPSPGIKLSTGQSCRPCASPSLFVGWLPAPHTKYLLYYTKTAKLFKNLNAPPDEEIYRLNWSNLEDYAVHMFGSRGNSKMTIRNILNGNNLFIGYGWDPDLWIGN